MKKLNINITKAQIKSFRVELGEEYPNVSATIALLTDGGKEISDYSISTSSWSDDNKFELPVSMVGPIVSIMKDLEKIVVKHCMESQAQLEAHV